MQHEFGGFKHHRVSDESVLSNGAVVWRSTLCDPYLNLFRGLIPPIGGTLDLSPILAFIVLDVRPLPYLLSSSIFSPLPISAWKVLHALKLLPHLLRQRVGVAELR